MFTCSKAKANKDAISFELHLLSDKIDKLLASRSVQHPDGSHPDFTDAEINLLKNARYLAQPTAVAWNICYLLGLSDNDSPHHMNKLINVCLFSYCNFMYFGTYLCC